MSCMNSEKISGDELLEKCQRINYWRFIPSNLDLFNHCLHYSEILWYSMVLIRYPVGIKLCCTLISLNPNQAQLVSWSIFSCYVFSIFVYGFSIFVYLLAPIRIPVEELLEKTQFREEFQESIYAQNSNRTAGQEQLEESQGNNSLRNFKEGTSAGEMRS